jgi:FtsP/CotA-like multicopper oxidase with cupredoxin domain
MTKPTPSTRATIDAVRAAAFLINLLLGVSGLCHSAEPSLDVPALPSALQEVRSIDGVLTVTLEAAEEPVTIGRVTLPGAVYNHQYAGPMLRVHPGDRMRIRLVNHLRRITNLHFHGIDTSPRGNSDNMHISVAPGESFDYDVLIPATQPPGLYWYHDHTHGISRQNVMGGLSGALMVEGFRAQFAALATVREQVLVLKDYEFDESDDPYVRKVLHKFVQTVNGQESARVAMAPGETQLWHISNQSADSYFHLRLPGHRFRLIGQDGAATLKERGLEQIDIMPAERVEVLVTASAAGRYPLFSEGMPTGEGASKANRRQLGEVTVSGSPVAAIPGISVFPPREDLRDRRMDAYRTIRFSQLDDDEHFLIDGKSFDHMRTDTRVPLGNLEEWTVRNETDDFHEFHIHQVSFQVTEINGEPQPLEAYRDVVRVPERGEVKVRMAFTDPVIVGHFMYHCHILKHEDHGMMANIEVYDPAASMP